MVNNRNFSLQTEPTSNCAQKEVLSKLFESKNGFIRQEDFAFHQLHRDDQISVHDAG
jgi:hypothetical protein